MYQLGPGLAELARLNEAHSIALALDLILASPEHLASSNGLVICTEESLLKYPAIPQSQLKIKAELKNKIIDSVRHIYLTCVLSGQHKMQSHFVVYLSPV